MQAQNMFDDLENQQNDDLDQQDQVQQNAPKEVPDLDLGEPQREPKRQIKQREPKVAKKVQIGNQKYQKQSLVSQIIRQGAEQTKNLLDLDPQQQQIQLRKLIQQSKGRIVKYIPGQFSKFATIQQKSIQSMETYIRMVTQEASYSHLSKIKMLMKQARGFEKQTKQQKALKTIVDQTNLLTALQNPKKFFARNSLVGKNPKFKNFKQMTINYTNFMKYSRDFALVEGKLIQVAKLNLQSAFRHTNQEVLVPTTASNVYIRVGKGLVPQKRVLKNGKFIGMQSLSSFDQNTKKVIYDMVKLYLAKKGLLTTQTQKIIASQIDGVEKVAKRQSLLQSD